VQQSKLESVLEVTCNTMSGFLVALLWWEYVILPNVGVFSSWIIVGSFTVLSILRGYMWRRIFVTGTHRLIHSGVSKLYRRVM